MHVLSVVHAALSAFFGVSLGVWLECSIAAAMVVVGSVLFGLAWVFAPREGLLARWLRSRGSVPAPLRR
jgi:ABC-type Mn2+/Zn2+ transport system permease subunit